MRGRWEVGGVYRGHIIHKCNGTSAWDMMQQVLQLTCDFSSGVVAHYCPSFFSGKIMDDFANSISHARFAAAAAVVEADDAVVDDGIALGYSP